MPRVSVVVPVYNGARTVGRAIESILGQTFRDWELVACDDGSSDASFSLCEELSRRDPRIRVLRNAENRGLAATMNRLVAEAAGELVAIQEHDDESLPHRLARQVEEMDRRPDAGVVVSVVSWRGADGREVARFPGRLARGIPYPHAPADMVRYLYVEQCKVANASAMIRRSLFETGGMRFDEGARMSIDWQFYVHVAHVAPIYGIPEVLVNVDRSEGRSSLTANKDLQFAEARRCIRVLYERYGDDRLSPIDRALYRRAMAAELVLEARTRGGLRAVGLLASALVREPGSIPARMAARGVVARGAGRVTARLKDAASRLGSGGKPPGRVL
jgi:glycosyltransferase involved in cell wall biosynthesis